MKELYPGENLDKLITFFKSNIKGILHVGAHKCEEQITYEKYALNSRYSIVSFNK